MKWFMNLKIGIKLIAGFILMAVIAGIVGIIGITNINKVDKGYSEAYVDYGIALGDLAEAAINYQKTRVIVRDVLIDGATNKDLYEEKLKKADEQIEEALAKFEEKIKSDHVKSEFIILKENFLKFKELRNNVIAIHLSGQTKEAMKLMRGDALQVATELENGIDALFTQKESDGLTKSEDLSSETKNTILIMVLVVIIGMVISISLGLLISSLIGRPIRKMVKVAEKIAEGNLDVSININTADEVGMLASAFRLMTDNINEIMTNINSASEQVAAGSKQLSDSSVSLSKGATEQASSVEQLTASLEEIASQTKINADNAIKANEISISTKESALVGNNHMQSMLGAMNEINKSSASISQVIKVIDDIAFQTNILALNATVEAARAGQHGKGFAVVAEEVRNLAMRSANAAKETTALIEGSIQKVQEGTATAKQTAESLTHIVNEVSKVANLVGNIASASNEQAIGIDQVNQGVMLVSQVIQTNSSNAEESAAASEELASQADILKHQVERFKLKKMKQIINTDGNYELNWIIENINTLKKYIPQENKNVFPDVREISLNSLDKY